MSCLFANFLSFKNMKYQTVFFYTLICHVFFEVLSHLCTKNFFMVYDSPKFKVNNPWPNQPFNECKKKSICLIVPLWFYCCWITHIATQTFKKEINEMHLACQCKNDENITYQNPEIKTTLYFHSKHCWHFVVPINIIEKNMRWSVCFNENLLQASLIRLFYVDAGYCLGWFCRKSGSPWMNRDGRWGFFMSTCLFPVSFNRVFADCFRYSVSSFKNVTSIDTVQLYHWMQWTFYYTYTMCI